MCILGVPEKEMEQIEEMKYTQRLIEEINRKLESAYQRADGNSGKLFRIINTGLRAFRFIVFLG